MVADPVNELAVPDGFYVLKYDLLDKKHAGTLFVAGNAATADHCVICISDFPDQQTAFVPLAQRLATASDSNFFVAVACMPEYDRVGVLGKEPLKPEGYDVEELAICFEQAVEAFKMDVEAKKGGTKKIGQQFSIIYHDWGVAPALGYILKHAGKPTAANKVVAFDVLVGKNESASKTLKMLPYQLLFAFCFLVHMNATKYIGKTIGRFLSKFCLLIGGIWIFGVFGMFFKPAGAKDETEGGGPTIPPQGPNFTAHLFYAYYRIFKGVFFASKGKDATDNARATKRLMDFDAFAKAQPVLFVFGAEKGMMFHSTTQLEQLKAASFNVTTKEGLTKTLKSKVLGIENAGHWVYKHEEDMCFKAVENFLSE